jgi:hypothetical protein
MTKAVPHFIPSQRRYAKEERVPYLHLPDQPPIIDNDCDPIDDDLHQQLNLEHPQEQNAEEHGDTES